MDDIAGAVVRVLSADSYADAVGAGVLIAPDLVATCAHVVSEALGHEGIPDEAPSETVELDLPFGESPAVHRARVDRWCAPTADGRGDVALLRVEEPVGSPVAALRRRPEPWGERFRAAGFPRGLEDGVWSEGTFLAEQGSGWMQLRADATAPTVGPGFSGGPVCDGAGRSVVAIAVAAERAGGPRASSYAIPIQDVLDLEPGLRTNPYRGVFAFDSESAEFFFGRGDDLRLCRERLTATGLVAVLGPSGVGKSSLLHAGIAAEHQSTGGPVAAVGLAGVESEEGVTAAVAAALEQVTAPTAAAWRARLSAGRAAASQLAAAAGVLLVLDQFEELAQRAPQAAEAAVALVAALIEVGASAALTARSATLDLLGAGTAETLRAGTVFIQALTGPALVAAVEEPARHTPGPGFAPGVVTRIVSEAQGAPGRLPLLQALLVALWDDPDGGRLSMSRYDELGGVTGALVNGLDAVFDGDFDEPGRALARRVLLGMVTVTDDGPARRALPLAGLTPNRRAVLDTLARRRVVVITTGPGGEVAELSHQALLDHWPRLQSWITEESDFLAWRETLRGVVSRHRRHAADSLLRGEELAAALGKLAQHGEDLDPAELALIEDSRLRRRRDRRRLRAVLVVGVVLLVLAGSLAGFLQRSNNHLASAVDTTIAHNLGDLAQTRLISDPDTATELALAAYRADPANPDARSALGQVYLARRSTETSTALPLSGRPGGIVSDEQADVSVLTAAATGSVLATGLATTSPHFRPVPAAGAGAVPAFVAGRGRWVVFATGDSGLAVWDSVAAAAPRPLPGTPGQVDLAEVTPDDAAVLTGHTGPGGTDLAVTDLATGTVSPLAHLPETGYLNAWLTPDRARMLVRVGDPTGDSSALTLRDARTGMIQQTFPPSAGVAENGARAVWCADPDPISTEGGVVVADTVTGAQQRVASSGVNCSGGTPGDVFETADGHHLIGVHGGVAGSATDTAEILDLDDLSRGAVWVPAAVGLNPLSPQSPDRGSFSAATALRGTNLMAVHGGRVALLDGDRVDLLDPSPTPRWRDQPGQIANATPFHGDTVVVRDRSNALTLLERTSGRVLATAPPPAADPTSRPAGSGVTDADTYIYAAADADGVRVWEWALPSLTPLGVYDLPAHGLRGGWPLTDGGTADPALIAIDRTPQRMVIAAGGYLSWWSPTTHAPTAPPTPVPYTVGDPSTAQLSLVSLDPTADRAALFTDAGLGLYSQGAGTATAVLPARAVDLSYGGGALVAGGQLLTLEQPSQLAFRDTGTGQPLTAPLPMPPRTTQLAGTTPSGRVVTIGSPPDGNDSGNVVVTALDLAARAPSWRLVLPTAGYSFPQPYLDSAALIVDTDDDVVAVPTAASAWHDQLCGHLAHPFTPAQATALPAGTDPGTPC